MMWTRRLSPPIAMVLLLAACSFDFRREVELEPGDVSGRALRGAEGPAPYARVHVSGTGKEHRTRSDGSFLVRGLVPGGFVVELIDDKDGDGWPERTTRRAFTLTRASHASGVFGETEVRPTWVSLGDVRLEGIVEAEGRVLRADGTPAVGARVYGLRSAQLPASDDGRGALDVEMPADAEIATDIDGRFRFPALPAGALSFVAFLPGEGVLLASPPTTRAASPGVKLRDIELTLAEAPAERRVLLDLVPAPSADELVRVHWVEPGETPPLGQGSFSRTDPDVHEGNASIPLEVPLGAGDLWVETSAGRFGVLRRQIATMPGLDVVRWGLLVLGDEDVCAGTAPDGTAIRDCDHDGLQGLPPLDGEDDPNAEIWRACAPQCANAFGEAALGASCRVDGQIYDCDDDGDGQADVTESPACYGPGRGADPDGDGLCGLDDPYPQCRENDPEHPSCRAGGSFTEFPPPVRPDFQGGEEDAGPTPDGGDAGDDGGSNVDAGPDGGPDAGAGAFATLLADAEVSDVIRFGSGAALAINSEAPLDLGSGCALDGEELTAMVVLLDETGACQWRVAVRHTGAATAPRGARVSKLAVLEGGELLIVGTYTRQLGVADGHNDWLVEEPQSSDVFLVVVDESGLVTRAEGAGFTVVATEAIEIGAVTPLPDGGFVLGASPPSGETAIEIDGEPIEVGVNGMRSYFLVAFDSTFTPRWHHRGESYWDPPRVRGGVVVGEGASEHVVALVGFNGAFSTDGAELSTEYGAVALLAIPTNGPGRGTVSWFQQLERVSHADGSVALDANGAIVVAVSSPWELFFVDEDGWGDSLDLVGESTAVVRYDENGTRLGYHVWVARDFDSAISARKLERLPDGDFLIGGDYRRGFSLGPYDVFDASRENNIWVARVGLEEDVAQVRHLNLTAGHAYFRAMTSMPDGSPLVVGEGFRTLTLGGVQLDTGREGSEIPGGFVWRILPDGTSEDEQMDGFLEACTTAASCQSRSCAVPSWPTVVAGICAAICRVEEPDCPGNAACLPSGRDDGLGVCMVPDTCYRDEHCSDGRCNPFTLQCSPECSGQDDCASDESCYVELGVCVPDCRTDGCGVDEICAPNGGGHVCVPDCRRFEQCSDACFYGDGLCVPMNDDLGVYADTWVWDPAAQSWTHLPWDEDALGPTKPRRGHAIGASPEGVVVLGGFNHWGYSYALSESMLLSGDQWTTSLDSATEVTDRTWTGVFEPSRGQFFAYGVSGEAATMLVFESSAEGLTTPQMMSNLPLPAQEGALLAHDGLGNLWLYGSFEADPGVVSAYSEPDWLSTAPAVGEHPEPRVGHAFTYAGVEGQILMSGGRGRDGGLLDDTWLLITAPEVRWVRLDDAELGFRAGHAMAWDGERVVLYGGTTSRSRTESRDVLFFDAELQRWTAPLLAGLAPTPRTNARMAFDGTRIVLHGGERGPDPVEVHGDLVRATVGANGSLTWEEGAYVGAPVSGAAFATASDGSLWVFGGRDLHDRLTNQLVVYPPNGAPVQHSVSTNGPAPREGAGMAFHPVSADLFLFGGRGEEGLLDDLWVWNQALQRFIPILNGAGGDWPLPRSFFAMAPSTPDEQIFLFGGVGYGEMLDDVWFLRPEGTFERVWVTAAQPAPRANAAVASTPAGIFLQGGFVQAFSFVEARDELWLWHGDNNGRWQDLGSHWPAVGGATLTYEPDSTPIRLWMFGGSNSGAPWAMPSYFDYDPEGLAGTGTYVLATELGAVSPPERARHVAAFVGGKLVILGGSTDKLAITWE